MQTEKVRVIGTPGHSPALRYEVRLRESAAASGQHGPTPSRIRLCFEVFDEVLPQLGVFQRVTRMLRDELYAAVYSDEFTSGGGQRSRERDNCKPSPAKPERLPYIVITKRYMEKRGEETSKLEAEIASLKEQLYTCDADLEKASSAIEAYKHDVKERDMKLHRLGAELRSRTGECERLQKIVNQHQRAQDRLRQEVEYRMFSLRNTITTLKEENIELRRYKNTHDSIQEVLAIPQPFVPVASSDPLATPHSLVQQHSDTAAQLKTQLLTMQNSLMDEYDGFLNSHIQEMADEQATEAHAKIREQQLNFKHNIAAVSNELSLLHTHSDALSSHLVTLSSHPPGEEHRALVLPTHPSNPLVPQEQTTSKYAAMLFTSSDGGESFYPLKDAQRCPSCGEETVICPHKTSTGETTIQLPLRSTHLKITRPQLRVARAGGETDRPQEVTKKSTPLKPVFKQQGLHAVQPDIARIWAHFRSRFTVERSVPRRLTAEQLMTLMHQFYGAVLLQDDISMVTAAMTTGEEDHTPSLLESLYHFMDQRYQVPEVASLATHDFLSALSEHHLHYKEFLVLAHMLCGHLDGAAFRYLLLLASLVDCMPWSSIKEFSPWMALVYPTLQEEDVEHMTMNFIAHSSNRVSRHLVMEFLTWLLLRHREPRIVQLESRLLDHPCQHTGSMLEVEFAEAMDSLLPLLPDQLCRRLFMQSLSQLHEGGQSHRETVPTKRLAYIASYLSLLRSAPTILTELELLAQHSTAIIQPGTQHVATSPSSGPQLHTMETVRNMASRMSMKELT